MLLEQIRKQNIFNPIYDRVNKPGSIIHGLTNSAKSFLLANFLERSDTPIIFLTQNHHEAQTYFQEIKNLNTKADYEVYNFPAQEISPYDQINSDIGVLNKQYEIFAAWESKKPSLTVITYKAFAQLYIEKSFCKENTLELKVDDEELRPEELAKELTRLGYNREVNVESRGQFSQRGDITDIYPINGPAIRLEFFGDEVESIRTFDPQTQRSITNIKTAEVLPRHMVIRSEDDQLHEHLATLLENSKESLQEEIYEAYANKIGLSSTDLSGNSHMQGLRNEDESSGFPAHKRGSNERNAVDEDLEASPKVKAYDQELYWDGVEYFRELLNQDSSTLFDYLAPQTQVFVDEWSDLHRNLEDWITKSELAQIELLKTGKTLALTKPLLNSYQDITASLQKFSNTICLQSFEEMVEGVEDTVSLEFITQPAERFASKVEDFVQYIKDQLRAGQKIGIFSEQPQRVLGIMKEWDIPAVYAGENENPEFTENLVFIQRDGLEEGCKIPELNLLFLTDRELFGRSRQAIAKQKQKKDEKDTRSKKNIYTDISQLKDGNFVIHYKHGLGIYRGTEQVELDRGQKQEYLVIEYADEARVLIPVDQVNLLSRFNVNQDGKPPRLSKLGGQEWERTKKRVKKSVQKIAQDLINLYAAREKQTGYQYPHDTPWQIEMEDAFPYSETTDQLKAIVNLKEDMQSEKLVDRLICGDAGFGKTEVIIRAVFKAVMDGKQVAILVPTTVLAQQHFNTFSDRYAPYPIRTGLLCRFKSAKEQKELAKKITTGDVDVIVGTHRLLQKDINFKNLGLLVIDEEQRFGVAHKEKLKMIRKDLDVISMSATPIPRTLHMSLSGIKDISLISTAPTNRLPIKTFVGEYKHSVIRNAILHELERGGQIFFVHNRIESIERVAAEIQKLIPEATVRIGHGKMKERELEDVMFSFVNHEFDILVCTTIIETGLDISNANTMIIDNANHFGLSQLYQLRGRVGRSDQQAFAYLFFHPEKDISDTARQRLRAMQELTKLGSGYQVALRDMEIRGVGNVFGGEQHGHMLAVGFDLYCKMLSDTIEQMKGNIQDTDLETNVTVDIKLSAYFPDTWINDEQQRMNEYKRLSAIMDEAKLEEITDEWKDRFGRLPVEAMRLVEISKVKLAAKRARISMIKQEAQDIKIYCNKRLAQWLPIQRSLTPLIQQKTTFKPGNFGARNAQGHIILRAEMLDVETRLSTIKEIVEKLGASE